LNISCFFLILLLIAESLQLASLHFLNYLLSLRLYLLKQTQFLCPLPSSFSFILTEYLPDLGIVKQDLLATSDQYSIMMRSYKAFEDLQQLPLVLSLNKPIAFSLAEGTGEAIDEDESHAEEESEADGV
jgi:hypothetical protein